MTKSIEQNPTVPFATLHPNLLMSIYRAFELVSKRGNPGSYLEFGLYSGFSFWYANNLSHEMNLDIEFHGFDSFEGLPESRVDIHRNWTPGSYACTLEECEKNFSKWGMPSKYFLHKGWYSKEFFSRISPPPPSVVVIDCDIYESAKIVLAYLREQLKVGTILVFDDFNAFGGDENHGERRALLEFEKSYPSFQKKHLWKFGPYGEAFEVVAV